VRRSWLTLAVFGALGAGCSAIAGVDFGAVHPKEEASSFDAGPVTPGDDAGDTALSADTSTPTPDGNPPPPGCASDEKSCNGACVKKDDPLFGCEGAGCDACSLPFTTPVCKGGACAPGACTAGHADCDGDPKNGCEADLANPNTCGSCTVKCTGSDVCGPNGCTQTCPSPTQLCGGSCVDTTKSTANCGGCNKPCQTGANGDPVCSNSMCGIMCHTGFGDCDGNPANGCEPEATFFKDGDNDGYGGTVSTRACAAPAGYTSTGGDCADDNTDVHPGQTKYFATSFTNAAGAQSYDYDCSGTETEDPGGGFFHFPGCSEACTEEGYEPKVPLRSGSGVDTYCGSTAYQLCVAIGAPRVQLPTCTKNPLNATAVTCR
jgi:hypothetical protein